MRDQFVERDPGAAKEADMYNKILAPMDGSEFSECALSHLEAVATGCHVPEVVLLRVVEPFHQVAEVGEDFMRKAEKGALESAKSYLSEVADRLGKAGVKTSTVVLQGQAADEILDYAKKNKIDLIVMSTHGRSGVARWTMGSVADKIVRHSRAAVLTVSPAGCRV